MKVNNINSTNFGMALRVRHSARPELQTKSGDFIKNIKNIESSLKHVKNHHLILGESLAPEIASIPLGVFFKTPFSLNRLSHDKADNALNFNTICEQAPGLNTEISTTIRFNSAEEAEAALDKFNKAEDDLNKAALLTKYLDSSYDIGLARKKR